MELPLFSPQALAIAWWHLQIETMDIGRIAAGTPPQISSLDEDAISPRASESTSEGSLPDRAAREAIKSPPATSQHAAAQSRTPTAFARLPIEVIELYVNLAFIIRAHKPLD